jgi:hypothetical protein
MGSAVVLLLQATQTNLFLFLQFQQTMNTAEMDCLKEFRPLIAQTFGSGTNQILMSSNNGMDLPLEVPQEEFIIPDNFRLRRYYFVVRVMSMNR